MKTIIDIAINDLRVLFNDRSIWINLVIVPLVIAYVIGIANGGNNGTPTVANLIIDVINQDGGAISQQFLSDLSAANPNFVLCPQAGDACQLHGDAFDAELAEQRLQDQTSLALIEIPPNFTADIDAGQNASIVYRSNESAVAPSYILQAVQAETQRLGGALIAARVGSDVAANSLNLTDTALTDAIRQNASAIWAQNPARVEYVTAQQTESTTQNDLNGFKQSIPGIGTMYVLFTVIPASAAIIEERKQWTLPRLGSHADQPGADFRRQAAGALPDWGCSNTR